MKNLYEIGPVTGIENDNRPAFEAARDKRERFKFACDPDHSEYISFWVFGIVGFVAVGVLMLMAIAAACLLPDIIGWQDYPEAMLIDMALKAVG